MSDVLAGVHDHFLGRPGFVFSGSESRSPMLVEVFAGWKKVVNWLGIGLWLLTLLFFWQWWLQASHVVTWLRFGTVTLVLLWATLIPAYFILIFARARIPATGLPLPAHARMAIVVTKAPSEPWPMVRKTLLGALNQDGVVHDTWLADEDPAAETIAWCEKHKVGISTRKGVSAYHQTSWPRRTRCKEGNLAYFYDHFGYEKYDFVAQFDADHVPDHHYLLKAVAPFSDPHVGYVSAPSLCDVNADRNWSAHGRLVVEASLHGALQTGYNAGWAPLCIGSHYTVRTAALRTIGGLGPELAEDHSTSMMFNAFGWKGVHAVDAIAHGEGPRTFADLVTQELQWSRSLFTILMVWTPRYLSGLHGRIRFQFLFSQLWYPLFSVMMALMFALPVIALLTGENFANVTYAGFVIHMVPLSLVMILLAYWWRSTNTFRPVNARILSWDGLVFLFLRWPWSLIGCLLAVWDRATGRFVDFRITPKGQGQSGPMPFVVVAPYFALSMMSSLVALNVREPGTAAGFYIYNLINAGIYAAGIVYVLVRHLIENRVLPLPAGPGGIFTVFALATILAVPVAAIRENGLKGLAALNTGISVFTLTETIYRPAGAGMGKPGASFIRFKPVWHGVSTLWIRPATSKEKAS